MKEQENFTIIPIVIELSEDERLQTVTFGPQKGVFSLYFKDDIYYITEHTDCTKIYATFNKEMYNIWFNG